MSGFSTASEDEQAFPRSSKYRAVHLSSSNLKLMTPVLDMSRNSSHLSIQREGLGRKYLTRHTLVSSKAVESNLRQSVKGLGKDQLRVMNLRLKSQALLK